MPKTNMHYKFPKDLLKAVYSRWDNLVSGKGYVIPPLPPKESFIKLVETCYMASMAFDEGRILKFTVYYSENSEIVSKIDPTEEVDNYKFNSPRNLTLQELKRLAVITEDESLGIWVTYNEQMENKIGIRGFLNVGLGLEEAKKTYLLNDDRPPHTLTIRVLGPGEIKIYQGQFVIAFLSSGELQDIPNVSTYDYIGITPFINNALNSLNHYIEQPQFEIAKETIEYEWLTYLNIYIRIINIILSKKHGGTLLVMDDNRAINRALKELKIKYTFLQDNNILRENFINFINIRNKFEDLRWQIEDDDLTESNHLKLLTLDKDITNNYRLLNDNTRLVGNLSATDGAVVMTNTLKIIGFGAEIKSRVIKDLAVYKVEDPLKLDKAIKFNVEEFGMRHRSAMQFCSLNLNAFAIVVSQDGYVSLCWTDSYSKKLYFKKGISTINSNMVSG